jgi:hypothetical protein
VASTEGTTDRPNGQQRPAARSVSLPKGGGAIRGMGEKFAANPVTGTGALSIPVATTSGRSGFGPQLSQAYDSGSGNGPFGFGWNLSLPAIIRRTDKGLPQYETRRSQTFIAAATLAGAGVPVPPDPSLANEPARAQPVVEAMKQALGYRPANRQCAVSCGSAGG